MKGEGYQVVFDSEAGPPTLVKIPLDLQILICTLLHPSDILALRQTCKTLQLATRKRVVWVNALHRICLDNSLFLPSFPIVDMSDAELEHAAMGPRRWIELYAAFNKQHRNDSDATLRPRTTRIIEDSSLAAAEDPQLFIVPGGRYMVSHGDEISVWDLGYTSSADCKLIASVELAGVVEDADDYMVQATPDGVGLVILSYEHPCVYEIYPQSETPQLTRIAYLDFDPSGPPACLLPDKVLWDEWHADRIVFRVWDYRVNHVISFSADVDMKNFEDNIEVIATKTEIIVLCEEEILVWAIPPLLPQPPDFSDDDPTHIPPLLRMAFPDGIVSHDDLVGWKTMSQWYFGSSQHLYFDILRRDSKLHRFEIIVERDLLDTSLHLINTELVPPDLNDITFQTYRIGGDALVACWENDDTEQRGVYTGLTSSRFTTAVSHGCPPTKMLLPPTSGYNYSLCPASGRYVYLDSDIRRIVVDDLF